jgi:hypothetical protein
MTMTTAGALAQIRHERLLRKMQTGLAELLKFTGPPEEKLRRAMLLIVDLVVEIDFGHDEKSVYFSDLELSNMYAAEAAIEKCLGEARSRANMIELMRMLVHNGMAGAYANQLREMAREETES